MTLFAKIMVGLVAVEHIYILWLEMFAWTTRGKKTFKSKDFPEELFEKTRALAANQGLYNGFLAAGLAWALLIGDPVWSHNVALFFASCVVVAGVYGGATANRSIFFTQGIPAAITVAAILLS